MIRLVFFLSLAVSIIVLNLLRRKRYSLSIIKSIIISALIIVGGIGGTYILGYVESGSWGSISYYGSVFSVPLIMVFVSLIMGMDYSELMDYCTPCGCIAITVGKLFCRIQGCCGGRVIGYNSNGVPVKFPSQIVETVFGLILLISFTLFEKKGLFKRCRYPLFLVCYGAGRFVLNYLRQTMPRFGLLPSGNLWSIIAVIAGLFWIVNLSGKTNDKISEG